jgi:hypothetical protein
MLDNFDQVNNSGAGQYSYDSDYMFEFGYGIIFDCQDDIDQTFDIQCSR